MAELTLSENLKLLMFQKDIKTAQLARELSLPQQTLQRIVTGVTPRPHKNTLEPLAEFFGVTVEQLKGQVALPSAESKTQPSLHEVYTIAWSEIESWPFPTEHLKNQVQSRIQCTSIDPSNWRNGLGIPTKNATF